MRVWSIQRKEVLEGLEREGRWVADPAYAPAEWLAAYGWMAEQMRGRLGNPPPGASLPLWVWVRYEGEARPRPDLRRGGHLERGVEGVRIELEIPFERVLISEFDLWHYVLNGWYLAESEAEEARFERQARACGVDLFRDKPPLDPGIRQRLEESWTRIFQWEREYPSSLARPLPLRTLQGCVWEILASQVRRIHHFRAR